MIWISGFASDDRVLSTFMSVNRLRNRLQALDGKSYKAYKDLRGCHQFADFTLHIDYVQGDPFAAPSRVWVEMRRAIA